MMLPIYSRSDRVAWALVDDDLAGELIDRLWRLTSHGYVAHKRSGGYEYLHRRVMGSPNELVVDHVNGDKLDNRRCNLRVVRHAENLQNRGPNQSGTSRFRGVTLIRTGKWLAQAKLNGQYHYLGLWNTEEEAGAAAAAFRAKHMPFSADGRNLVDVVSEDRSMEVAAA